MPKTTTQTGQAKQETNLSTLLVSQGVAMAQYKQWLLERGLLLGKTLTQKEAEKIYARQTRTHQTRA